MDSLDQRLVCACVEGCLSSVKRLLDEGADIHFCSNRPLRYASIEGHLGIVRYLVEQGANVSGLSDWFLISICENDHLSVVKYLCTHGVNWFPIKFSYPEDIYQYLAKRERQLIDKDFANYTYDCLTLNITPSGH